MARTPIEPAGDTRPIAEGDQLEDQKKVLSKLYDRIDRFCERVAATRHERDEQARLKQRSSAPWRPIDDDRPNQVLMLDGRRGTGKTSLLLTALKTWRDSRAHTDGMRVIALDPVDFDPMPAGLSPFAWVVLTLRRLVDWLDDGCAPATAPYLWDDDSDETKPTLDALWQGFFRRAEIGWSKPARQDDIEDFIQHSREKQKGWLKLQDAWERLIDGLFEAAERQRKVSQDSVIVLPIDDLDLAPRRAREVLLTLRQLYHERVVFLLTGDVAHLRNVLELRQFGAEWVEGAPKAERKRTWRRVQGLTVDLVNKVIPPQHRLSVLAVGLWEALLLAAKRTGFGSDDSAMREYLNYCLSGGRPAGDDGRSKAEAARIYQVALDRKRATFHRHAAYRIRDLVQAVEQPLAPDPRIHLFGVLTSARPPDGSKILDASTLRGRSLRVIPRSWGGTGDSDRSRMRATRFRVWDEKTKRSLNLIEQIVLRAQLLPIMLTNWNTSSWLSPLAHTSLRLSSGTYNVPWPGFPVTGLADAEEKARQLRYFDIGDLFRAWLLAHLQWSGLETEVERTLSTEEALERLVVGANANDWLGTWLKERLPALCAPEHGLEDSSCYLIFQALSGVASDQDEWDAWTKAWGQTRKAMLAAFRVEEPGVDDLQRVIDRKYPAHAWHHQSVFGPRGTWLRLQQRSGRSIGQALYDIRRPHGMSGPDLYGCIELSQFDHDDRPRSWPEFAITRFLVTTRTLRQFADGFEDLRVELKTAWPAKYLVGIWKLLVTLSPDPSQLPRDIARWFESLDSGEGLDYRGPPDIQLTPEWISTRNGHPRTPSGWRTLVELPTHLVAWLCVIQEYASRLPEPTNAIVVPRIRDVEDFPPWPEMNWLTAEYALHTWEATQAEFAEAGHVPDGVLHDAYLLNWLACGKRAFGHSTFFRRAPIEMPISATRVVGLLDGAFGKTNNQIREEHRPHLRRWLRELRSTVHFTSPKYRKVWDRWWSAHDERAERAALKVLPKMSVDDIFQKVNDSRLAKLLHEHFESGKTASRLEDLAEITHVGPKSIEKLRLWAESLL